jgi:hypothetical protein
MMQNKYKIIIHLSDYQRLTFHVQNYERVDDTFIRFYDERKNEWRRFSSRICEIIELEG